MKETHNTYCLSTPVGDCSTHRGKMPDFQKFFRVRPRNKFSTREIKKSTEDDLANILHWIKNIFTWLIQKTQRCRNSRPEVFCKKGVLRYFAKFTGKNLCQSLYFNYVTGLRTKNTYFYRTPPVAASRDEWVIFQCQKKVLKYCIILSKHP